MKLFEYQAQKLLNDYDIPVPGGKLAYTPREVYDIVRGMNGKAVIKAQVLTGGRGKAGGIKLVSDADEAQKAAHEIFGLKIKNIPVTKIFVTPVVEIKKEFYAAIVVNRSEKRTDCILCNEGGVEIEELAKNSPERINIIPINFNVIKEEKEFKSKLAKIFLPGLSGQFFSVITKMFSLFVQKDCSLVEINPLVLDGNDNITALDAKIVIDDSSLFKHPELETLKNDEEYSQDEIDAKKSSLAFVSLEGNIGCIVNGAGLAMATMDLIKYYGEEPANFLDIGGSSNPQKVIDGFEILMRNKNIKAILINIFGGITRCDDIAKGLVQAVKQLNITLPLVIRLIGTNDAEGREILKTSGFSAYSDLSEAVQAVVKKIRM